MAFNVVTPDNLEYFKTKQDEYNIQEFSKMFAAKSHTHVAGEIDAAPLAHNHSIAEVEMLQEELNGKASSTHTHNLIDVIGLEAAIEGKAEASHTHTIANIADLQSALNEKAALSHTHEMIDVVGLNDRFSDIQSSIDAKAASSHTHTASNITDLQGLLDVKADATHTHTKSNITGLESDLNIINGSISSINTKMGNVYNLKGASTIASNSNLDNMKTIGNYVCNLDATASTISNSPTGGKAFALKVGDLLDDGKYPYQEVTRYTDGMSWRRTYNRASSTWNAWYSTSFATARKVLWTGTWNAGTINASGIQNYSVYMFYANSGAMMIGFKSYDGTRINCYGIICPERNIMRLESATFTISGETLTRTMPRSWTLTGTAITSADGALVITMIEGLF